LIEEREDTMPIEIVSADITRLESCAVVNAANSSLMGGGGVDGAIHAAAGESLADQCRRIRKERYPDGLPTGEAVATGAGDMKAKYIIHTVGPIWGRCAKQCDTLLENSYLNSMKLAYELGCREIAFPAISTGIYSFPAERAARIAYGSALNFLARHPDMRVIFVFHGERNREIFEKANAL